MTWSVVWFSRRNARRGPCCNLQHERPKNREKPHAGYVVQDSRSMTVRHGEDKSDQCKMGTFVCTSVRFVQKSRIDIFLKIKKV